MITNSSRGDTLNLDGAADLLYMGTSQLSELARAGVVPGAKIGKSWVFSRALLLDWLAEETARQVAQRKRPKAKPGRMQPPDLSRYA